MFSISVSLKFQSLSLSSIFLKDQYRLNLSLGFWSISQEANLNFSPLGNMVKSLLYVNICFKFFSTWWSSWDVQNIFLALQEWVMYVYKNRNEAVQTFPKAFLEMNDHFIIFSNKINSVTWRNTALIFNAKYLRWENEIFLYL